MQKHFESYIELRNEIDELSEKLENNHRKHMMCKAGCDLCCMDYSVFPIEFEFILSELKKKAKPEINTKAKEEDCIFLNDHKCSIYDARPIICRTHGLPLLYTNENDEWELSACELNFTDFPFEEFSEENTYPQDKFNSKLFLLNKDFISASGQKHEPFDLIPIKDLKKYL